MFTEEELKEIEDGLEISMEPVRTEEQDDDGIAKPLLCLTLAFVIAVVGVRVFIWVFELFVLNRAG